MSVRMSLRGLPQIKERIRKMPRAVHTEVDKALDAAARSIAADAETSILTGIRTGRMYGSHQASAPGEPPANRTGVLANSISAKRVGNLEYQIVAGAPYAIYLEEGTIMMDKRPFLIPALKRGKTLITFLVKQAIERGLRKATKGKSMKGKK